MEHTVTVRMLKIAAAAAAVVVVASKNRGKY
jgi:hypothetical protein